MFVYMCAIHEAALTALIWFLIRVVSTVVLSITRPGEGFTQSIVALELVMVAVTLS